jgi:DNA-directed RNA polymerase subunit M/transcription elongation factor TFIIS
MHSALRRHSHDIEWALRRQARIAAWEFEGENRSDLTGRGRRGRAAIDLYQLSLPAVRCLIDLHILSGSIPMPSEPQTSHERACPKCGGSMKWYRSEAERASQAIKHVFSCTKCGSLSSVSTVAAVIADGDPDMGDEVLASFRCDWLC